MLTWTGRHSSCIRLCLPFSCVCVLTVPRSLHLLQPGPPLSTRPPLLGLQVQGLFGYWSASSLPMRKDGVFRAVPNSALQVPAAPRCVPGNARCLQRGRRAANGCPQNCTLARSWHPLPPLRDAAAAPAPPPCAQEGDKVVAQFGAWSAIVSVGGELFQASQPLWGTRCSTASLHSRRSTCTCRLSRAGPPRCAPSGWSLHPASPSLHLPFTTLAGVL